MVVNILDDHLENQRPIVPSNRRARLRLAAGEARVEDDGSLVVEPETIGASVMPDVVVVSVEAGGNGVVDIATSDSV